MKSKAFQDFIFVLENKNLLIQSIFIKYIFGIIPCIEYIIYTYFYEYYNWFLINIKINILFYFKFSQHNNV